MCRTRAGGHATQGSVRGEQVPGRGEGGQPARDVGQQGKIRKALEVGLQLLAHLRDPGQLLLVLLRKRRDARMYRRFYMNTPPPVAMDTQDPPEAREVDPYSTASMGQLPNMHCTMHTIWRNMVFTSANMYVCKSFLYQCVLDN